MNKKKSRIEQALTTHGFIKVESDFWARFPFPRQGATTRLDAVLGAQVLAQYTAGVWTMCKNGAPKSQSLVLDLPADVLLALDLLGLPRGL
jgi:hypothetical protein